MAGLKYYERTKYILELIEKRKTGTPKELSKKLNVTERTVYNIINSLKCLQDEEIVYSPSNRSYIFQNIHEY